MIQFADWVPPIIFKTYAKYRPVVKTPWFPNYETALAQLGSYNQADIVDVVAQKTQVLKDNPSSLINTRILLQNLFVFQSLQTRVNHKLSVVDIGGACGANYFILSKYYPKKISRWFVIETEKMVSQGNLKFKDNLLDFSTAFDFSNQKNHFDLCFAQGVLQYLPNPTSYFQQLLNYHFPYLYISRQPLGQDITQPLIINQTSKLSAHGPGKLAHPIHDKMVEFPCTILPYQLFLDQFKKDYQTIYTFEEEPRYQLKINHRPINVCVMGWLLKHK